MGNVFVKAEAVVGMDWNRCSGKTKVRANDVIATARLFEEVEKKSGMDKYGKEYGLTNVMIRLIVVRNNEALLNLVADV